MKWIAIIFSWLVVTGCSKNIYFELPADEELTVTNNDTSRSECVIAPDSEIHRKLSNWLLQNTDGWKSTPASYMPGLIVKGADFSLNYLDELVILNYEGGQYSHKVQSNEYQFLGCEVRT